MRYFVVSQFYSIISLMTAVNNNDSTNKLLQATAKLSITHLKLIYIEALTNPITYLIVWLISSLMFFGGSIASQLAEKIFLKYFK